MEDGPLYHALLIGCDAYPEGYRSLSACVNDIDAVERVLVEPPGAGVPPERVRFTRLAALRPGAQSQSRLQAVTLPPTRTNIVAALRSLAGPGIERHDRVLIYYSGHGDQKQWPGTTAWHEALVPVDLQYLYDIELNALLRAIAARTSDVTMVLDCCHSAGATRDLQHHEQLGTDRFLDSGEGFGQPPDAAILTHAAGGARAAGLDPGQQMLDSAYLLAVACQAVETAGEGGLPGEQPHGIFTHALLGLLSQMAPSRRAEVRWADVWPRLLDDVAVRCAVLRRRPQHPWLIGRPERRVFGGTWVPCDPGYPLTEVQAGIYTVGAGRLMGVTAGAQLAVYGREPARFPPVGSAADSRVRLGQLRVDQAERATCRAELDGMSFDLPPGARARLVRPGPDEALRMLLVPPDGAVANRLEEQGLVRVVAPDEVEPEAIVTARPAGGWTIGDDVEVEIAIVAPDDIMALRDGLHSFAWANAALRLARSSADPELHGCLDTVLLDCTDPAGVAAAALSDPLLPEAPRDAARVYSVANGFRFCVRLTNTYRETLYVTLLNRGAGGEVQYLGDVSLQAGDRQVLWLAGQHRIPFIATPDFIRGGTDRLVAVATTRPDVSLRYLEVRDTVQQVVDASRDAREVFGSERPVAGPAELWTAVVTPVRIGPARR